MIAVTQKNKIAMDYSVRDELSLFWRCNKKRNNRLIDKTIKINQLL